MAKKRGSNLHPPPLNLYGLERMGYNVPLTGDRDNDQLTVEMICFRVGMTPREGGLGKFGHLKNIIDLCWNNPRRPSPKRFIWCRESEKILRECCKHDELGVAGPSSLGKCWAPDTPILKFDGSIVRADQVRSGDVLMGDDSGPRTVQEVHTGRGPMYRVTPEDGGMQWECTGNHVLVVRDDWGNVTEISAEQFSRMGDYARLTMNQFRQGPNPSETSISVEPIGEGDWVGFSVDGNHRLLLGDFTVNHNSDPLALWAVVNYIADPTHTKVLIMSTTIGGAKMRIWKTFKEYIETLPDYPGKPLWGTNRLLGPTYEMKGFGDSSGVYLLAGEKGKEKDALDNLIGIKAPATGDPDISYESLRTWPEFEGFDELFDEDELEDILPRYVNLCTGRPGRIIFIIDEATGIVESVYNAIYANMKPGNPGKLQTIMIGNPNLHWDVFGLFCAPGVGWDNVTLKDYEWETKNGGWCIRFNAEESSLIRDNNKQCSWMQDKEEIEDLAGRFGKKSLYYYRFVLGMWCPEGADFGVYSQGDVTPGMKSVTWGYERPRLHSSLDPSFAAGGDKPSCTFFLYGTDMTGKKVMEVKEQVAIKIDAGNKKIPIPYQVVREWKKECLKRGVPPERAAFDSTGGGVVFAGIVAMEWSAKVQAISSGGKASVRPVGKEKDEKGSILKANQRFANRATEIWYGAHPFLRSGQIGGITTTLAKEICSRRHADNRGGDTGRTVQVEDKKTYKKREGSSPDDADSFFVGVEHLRTKYGFKPAERAGDETPTAANVRAPSSSWEKLKARARRVTLKKNLPRV